MRPEVWENYKYRLNNLKKELSTNNSLSENYNNVVNASTKIDCFDYWASELKNTGYLHNHSRMWFASIWVFTLKLPWELGADFFYRNLLDADPASNTLSWRWVSGIQTKGKHYVASRENIRKFTNNRFDPIGLNKSPKFLEEDEVYYPKDIEEYKLENHLKNKNSLSNNLIIFEEDLLSDFLDYNFLKNIENIYIITNSLIDKVYNIDFTERSREFSRECILDTEKRLKSTFPSSSINIIENTLCLDNIKSSKYSMLNPKVGYFRDFFNQYLLNKIEYSIHVREIDTKLYPHAKKGFFSFKDFIKAFILEQGL